MKKFPLFVAGVAFFALTSCGGSDKSGRDTDSESNELEEAMDELIEQKEQMESLAADIFDDTEEVEAEEVSSSSDSDSDSSSSSASSAGSNKIDKFLDKYESFMKRYVKMARKAESGDPSALIEYAGMLSDYKDLCEEAEDLEDEMTAEQAARLSRLAATAAEL